MNNKQSASYRRRAERELIDLWDKNETQRRVTDIRRLLCLPKRGIKPSDLDAYIKSLTPEQLQILIEKVEDFCDWFNERYGRDYGDLLWLMTLCDKVILVSRSPQPRIFIETVLDENSSYYPYLEEPKYYFLDETIPLPIRKQEFQREMRKAIQRRKLEEYRRDYPISIKIQHNFGGLTELREFITDKKADFAKLKTIFSSDEPLTRKRPMAEAYDLLYKMKTEESKKDVYDAIADDVGEESAKRLVGSENQHTALSRERKRRF
jgi:hypothetical protein